MARCSTGATAARGGETIAKNTKDRRRRPSRFMGLNGTLDMHVQRIANRYIPLATIKGCFTDQHLTAQAECFNAREMEFALLEAIENAHG